MLLERNCKLVMIGDSITDFDSFLSNWNQASVNWDRVHPNIVGHMLIARTFLKTVGLDLS